MVRVVLLLVLLLACGTAHAGELSVTVSGGMTTFMGPSLTDGAWHQLGNNFNMDNTALNWGASINYTFNPRWMVSAGYRNIGTTRLSATFWNDPDYDLLSKSCVSNCQHIGNLTASDAMQLIELSATRTWRNDSGYFLGLRAGGAYAFHRFSVENHNHTFAQKHHGYIPMGVVGVSIGYKFLSVETSYYQKVGAGFADDYPISTQFVLTTLNLTIPLW